MLLLLTCLLGLQRFCSPESGGFWGSLSIGRDNYAKWTRMQRKLFICIIPKILDSGELGGSVEDEIRKLE